MRGRGRDERERERERRVENSLGCRHPCCAAAHPRRRAPAIDGKCNVYIYYMFDGGGYSRPGLDSRGYPGDHAPGSTTRLMSMTG